jgi:tartrate-resistant acid phosphatase type 5
MNVKSTVSFFMVFGLLALLPACAPSSVTPLPATATAATASPTLLEPSSTTLPASPIPSATLTTAPESSPTPNPSLRFAVIGDFGDGNQSEADVAGLVHSWNPDIIFTVGDNNYPDGQAATIDANIGQFYHDFIFPYPGTYGAGAPENRFFPTLGNHDWHAPGAQPYLDYFNLPGNERYYDFVRGPVHFFAVDSDENEPDGVGSTSIQAAWLQQGLAASTSAWNIVYFHYPPYSSGMHGSITWMRWPFAAWGANAVLSGHDHSYERLLVDGIPYLVDGLGGGGIYDFYDIQPESQFRYNADYGAMLMTATGTNLHFEFISRAGKLIDQYEVQKP